MKKRIALSVVLSFISCGIAHAGTVSISAPFTDPASTGIDSSNTYTHAVSGGSAQTVNGVPFDRLAPGVIPAGFDWTYSNVDTREHNGNFGQWNPVAGLVGTEAEALLRDFTFMADGANPGSSQTYTLSGLTPGSLYSTRIYVRVWDEVGSGRPMDLTFTHGTESDTLAGLLEDRPNLVAGGSIDDAYYVVYDFTAKASDLQIVAAVPDTAPANSGSFHLYALTNQTVIPEPTSLALALLGLVGLLGCGRRRRR